MNEISNGTWSESDAANNAAPPNGWPEGQSPSSVNDCARMMMGAVKRFWSRANGAYATTGSANVYLLTPDTPLAAYVVGERYSFRASFTNTAAATLNISGLGAKPLKKMTSAGKAEVAAGDLQSGAPMTVEYDGTDLVLCTPVGNAGVPAGLVAPYAGSAVPAGWLLCDGSAVSRTSFAALFAAIATTYGAGDGSTTFNLPDLRGRVAIGKDDMGGSAASRITAGVSGIPGTTLGAAGGDQRMHQHSHGVTDPGHVHFIQNNGYPAGANIASGGGLTTTGANSSSATTGISIQNAGSGASQNVQPSLVLNYIIKA